MTAIQFVTVLLCCLHLVVPALCQQQCLIALITESQKLVRFELIFKIRFFTQYRVICISLFSGILVIISVLCIGILTYDSALKQDWASELEERETARHIARIRAVCALHGESACACMGKYIIGRAVDGSITQEQDANELWAQQMKPTETNEEYRDHVD